MMPANRKISRASLRARASRHVSPRRPNMAVEALEPRALMANGMTETALPIAASQPLEIAAGPDGNLWATEYTAGKIARISTTGAVTGNFAIPGPGMHRPYGIASGPGG